MKCLVWDSGFFFLSFFHFWTLESKKILPIQMALEHCLGLVLYCLRLFIYLFGNFDSWVTSCQNYNSVELNAWMFLEICKYSLLLIGNFRSGQPYFT